MDPETLAFLKRVAKTVLLAFIWLAIICIAAIWGDNAFVGNSITLGNILFYTWAIVSVFIAIYLLKKIWVESSNQQ